MPKYQEIKTITIVGAGNVGWHLAHLFKNAGVPVDLVISREAKHARDLARLVDSRWHNDFETHVQKDSLIFLTLNDSAIDHVLPSLKLKTKYLVHTSGSLPMSLLNRYAQHYGVFYPFQTFTKNINITCKEFPVCIEGSDPEFTENLKRIANKITTQVYEINSKQREVLHIAGIIINNFTNHLLTLGIDFLQKERIPADLLLPLLEETIHKARKNRPGEIQTGPARRANQKIIDEHIYLLNNNLALQEIYRVLSDSIINYYHQR